MRTLNLLLAKLLGRTFNYRLRKFSETSHLSFCLGAYQIDHNYETVLRDFKDILRYLILFWKNLIF
jgi:hypothetical protein